MNAHAGLSGWWGEKFENNLLTENMGKTENERKMEKN
jgi:hypothetical protein